jgi:hypothetical protein
MDQLHADDIGMQLAHSYDIPVFGSIRAAMTLGGEELGVDAVLVIGEHGDYPLTSLGLGDAAATVVLRTGLRRHRRV